MGESLRDTTVSKDYVDGITRSMSDSLVAASSEGRIMTVNAATCLLLGCDEAELIGSPLAALFADEARAGTHRRAAKRKTFSRPSTRSARTLRRATIRRRSPKSPACPSVIGHLRRDPDAAPDSDHTGYDFWLTKLNNFKGDFVQAEMVRAFLEAGEYRKRFGQ